MQYAKHVAATPQSEPLIGRDMVKNSAGGYAFKASDWQRLERFLIIGTEGGSYYASERALTRENAECVQRCLDLDAHRTISEIHRVSDKGLAPKNDAAIFALALASVHPKPEVRRMAFIALKPVCRIGTHLFQFLEARKILGGKWSRSSRNAVAAWYATRSIGDLVTQALKYQNRNGWSHRDALRLAHPSSTPEIAQVFDAICHPEKWAEVPQPLAIGYTKIQLVETAAEAAKLVSDYRLPREVVPTKFLTDPLIWEALLPHMGLTALIRNLGNMGKSGLLHPLMPCVRSVVSRLDSEVELRKSRLHPFQILLAAQVYGSGHGVLGSGTWTPVQVVGDALSRAFYAAFQNVEPTGKRHMLAIDVSGSMGMRGGPGGLTPAQAAAAMAMVTARTEPAYYAMGFSTGFVDLKISASDTIQAVLQKTSGMPFGGTDTSVAIRWAQAHKVPVDVFVVYTDGETWAGNHHTSEALKAYRNATGIAAKLAVVNFVANKTTIADPTDFLSMDLVGYDASMPAVLASFVGQG